MAEPLSITASVITLLQLVMNVAKVAKSWYLAPEGLESLLNDLADSQIIVQSIDDSIRNYKDVPRTPQDELEGLTSKLQAVKILVLELEQLAHNHLTKPSPTIKVNRTSWTIAKTKVAKLRNELKTTRDDIRERLGLLKLSCIEIDLGSLVLIGEKTATNQLQLQKTLEASSKKVSEVAELQHRHEHQWSLTRSAEELLVKGQHETHHMVSQLLNKFTLFEKGLLPASVTAESKKALPIRGALKNTKDALTSNAKVSTVRTATATNYEYLEVHTRYSSTQSCDQKCTCVCHAQRRASTPESLRSAMGRLFMGYSGLPMLARECTESTCKRTARPSLSATYYFPQWWFAQAMLHMIARLSMSRRLEFALEVPRVRSFESALFYFAWQDDLQGLKGLFDRGMASPIDVRAGSGETALSLALRASSMNCVQHLLDRGADPHMKDNKGRSAADVAREAILCGDSDARTDPLVGKLIQAGSLGDSDFTELHETVLRSENTTALLTVIQKLVTTSAMIDEVDSFKRNALSWAAARADFKAVELLLEYGSNPNAQDILGRTPLHHAALTKSSSRSLICIGLLLTGGADANCIDIDRRTPIYAASKQQNTSTLALLLPHTALHHIDVLGRSPLHHTQGLGYEDSAAELLISNGCIIDQVDKKGITPLQVAIGDNRHETIRVLLDNGADYRKIDNQEWGLLHFAASYANIKSLKELSRKPLYNVDVHATNKRGRTAQELFDGRELDPTPELCESWQCLLAQVEKNWECEKVADILQAPGDGVDPEWGSSSEHESHCHYEDAVEDFA